MPLTGSQIMICDLPVRYDTYKGCSHACRYCFVNRKSDISNIELGESIESLEAWMRGERGLDCKWVDWNIPIHFGGVSDPFQPAERKVKRTLEALKIFAKYKYPFVISTKNKMIAEEPYLSLIKESNCVVQISAMCPEYDQIEKGASTFAERMAAIRKISPFKRVIVRMQPYLPQMQLSALKSLKVFADAGVYGVTIEGMKYFKRTEGTVRVGGDNCYPAKLLREHFTRIKNQAHALGMKFYCAENRLRAMGDDLCCCGVDGMGWKVNKGNLVHIIKGDAEFTKAQESADIEYLCANLKQRELVRKYGKEINYKQLIMDASKTRNELLPLIPEDEL